MTKAKEDSEAPKRKAGEIQEALDAILGRYTRARMYEAFGKQNRIWSEFERGATALRASHAVRQFPNVVVRWSAGQGRWATVPWIAALDSRETSRTSEGYCVR